ncbi:RAB family [Caenorhabditis elegans]|nr:RAB family [Caenorhabditis elegans]CAI3841864.1 RAB family [Caenorhabditis elegans]
MDHISTLGVDFKLKTIKLGRDKIRLELWDTAGMERYRTIYNSYYHSAHGVMCVYDMTNEKSFENLEKYWLKEIKQHAPPNAVLMLVGNKADMDQERKVDFDRAEKLASRLGVSLYEVSAKTGINCEEAFHTLTAAMRERITAGSMHSDESDDNEEFSSAFHVDGVIKSDKGKFTSCCASAPEPAFV